MFFLDKKSDCLECGKCIDACPINTLFFIKHEDGYRYPVDGGYCIWCGKCQSVCPVSNYKKK